MYDNSTALLRVLAAVVIGRTAISLGPVAAEQIVALLAGLDITSRLVVASGNDSEMKRLRALAPEDLRLSLHVQALDAFLVDIAAHRFGMLLLTPEAEPVALTALDMVEPGAVVVGMTRTLSLGDDPRFECTTIGVGEVDWIAVRRQHPRPARRGRRRRQPA